MALLHIPDRELNPPDEYWETGLHEKEEKEEVEHLVWKAEWRLREVTNSRKREFKHDDIIWAKKVLLRCEDIKDKVFDYWDS